MALSIEYVAALCLVLVGSVGLSIARDLRRLDDPYVAAFAALSLFWLVGIGLHPLFPSAPQPTSTSILLVLGGASAYLLGGVVGEAVVRRVPRWPIPAFPAIRVVQPSDRSAHVVQLIALAVGLALAMAFFAIAGIPILQGEVEQGRVDARSGLGYLVIPSIALVSLSMLALIAGAIVDSRRSRIVLVMFLVAVSIVVLAVIGNRGPVAKVLLAGFLITFLARGVLPPWRSCVLVAVATLVLLAAVGAVRSGSEVTIGHVLSRSGWQLYVNNGNLASLTGLIPDQVPFQLGGTYVIDAAVLLPGPQPNLGQHLKELMELDFPGGGITIGLFGESYANWGVAGALIILFVVGIALWMSRALVDPRDPLSLAWVVVMAINLAGVMQTGIVSVALNNLVPITGAYLVMRFASKRLRTILPDHMRQETS